MIRSTKQYATTKKRLDEFEAAIREFDIDAPPAGVSPLGHRTALAALKGVRDELAHELARFEDLERRGIEAVRFKGLNDLPRALVETRLARGMSQKELAEKLEVAPQQVQRWEADCYDRTGLAYVLEIGEVLKIDDVLRFNQVPHKTVVSAEVPAQILSNQSIIGGGVGGGALHLVLGLGSPQVLSAWATPPTEGRSVGVRGLGVDQVRPPHMAYAELWSSSGDATWRPPEDFQAQKPPASLTAESVAA